MQYFINAKNVKQSISNLSSFLESKNYKIPYNTLLEGFSRSLFLRNWNTLDGIMKNPNQIEKIKPQYQYILELTVDISKQTILDLIKKSFKEANAQLMISDFREKDFHFYLVFDLQHNNKNILTALFLFCKYLKEIKTPESIEFCRVQIEKESLINFFK